jgi:hypothetical protein
MKDPDEQDEENCGWGEPSHSHNSNTTTSSSSSAKSLPFVKEEHHVPPEGFLVDARVFTDAIDKLAHFEPTPLLVPYFVCTSTGITTSPLQLQHANFRHPFFGFAALRRGRFDNHAVLLVTLTECILDHVDLYQERQRFLDMAGPIEPELEELLE